MNNKENQELQKKYHTSNSFQKQMNSISNKFLQFQQQAYYSEFGQSCKNMIIQIKADSQLSKRLQNKQYINYYIFIGANQPNGNSCIEKTILNIINLLPRPNKTYSIIYINTNASKNAYSDFKKVTQFLPKDYYINLDKIYVLHASFVDKAMSWVSFNILTNFIKEKTVHLGEYKQLVDATGLNADQLLNLFPESIQKQLAQNEEFADYILTNKAMKMITGKGFGFKQTKSQTNQAYNKNQLTKVQQLQKKPYEQPHIISKSSIIFMTTKKATKRHIQEYKIGQTGAPLPLEILIYYFNNKDDSLKTEGIFRKSVSIDDQNQILAQIDEENYDYIQTITDPHIIANAIKRFVSYLIVPAIPYPQFQLMMDSNQQNFTKNVIEIVRSLPDVRKKTILILLQFFIEKVIPKQNFNKMSIKNVCIVIGPCLMHSEVASIKDLVFSQKIINVTYTIFKQFDNIFGSKKERLLALRKSAKSFSRAEMEDRLGRNQSKINDPNLKEATLTPSQEVVIKQSQKKQESKTKPSPEIEDHKLKLFHKMSSRMKEQMLQDDKNEQEEFYQIAQFQAPKEMNLSKNKTHTAYIFEADLTIKQEDFVDI